MSYNGSGVWSANSTGLPVVTGTTITTTMFNAFTTDVATGLSTAVCKDGQQTTTAAVPFLFGLSCGSSGVITGTAGAVGAPGINVGDSATGVYAPASNQVGVSVSGTQRGLFSASGFTVTGTLAVSGSSGSTFGGTSTYAIIVAGNTGSGEGAYVTLKRGSVVSGYIGSAAYILGSGTVEDFGIASGTAVPVRVFTNASVEQFRVTHTASATAYVTATGSNGGNPAIGSSGGTLAISGHAVLEGVTSTGATGTAKIAFSSLPTFDTTIGVGAATASASGSGVTFPATQSASSNANTLDDYDEYTSASTACANAITTAVVWKLTKVGNVVTLTVPAVTGTAGGSNVNFVLGLTIPAKYRPAADVYFLGLAMQNNAALSTAPGLALITTAGLIIIYRDGTQTTAYTNGAAAGIQGACGISWTI